MFKMIAAGRDGHIALVTESFGNPDDPPVVLVMGATASMLWWPEELCRRLAEERRFVIRYDNRDTGQSSACPAGTPDYVIEEMAEDLMAILDGFGVEKADIVGMSLGGLIGQMAALRWPERIRSLTLIGCEPLGWTGPELPGIAPGFLEHFGGMAGLDWHDRNAVTDFMLQIARLSAGSGGEFDETAALRRIAGELDRAADIRSAFNHAFLQMRGDWSGRLADIRKPVLILHGEEDPVLPLANGEALASSIAGARLVVLNGVGHELPQRAIPLIAGTLGRFFAAIQADTRC